MSERYKLRSVIICDDVRQEISGKEILIGVYNYSVLFHQFPAGMPQLVMKIAIKLIDKEAKSFLLHLRDPNGTVIGQIGGDLTNLNYDEPVSIGAIIVPLTFYAPGLYTIDFALDGDPLEIIYDFEVRLPKDENERKRIPAQPA
jgi:hypothetical protein